jgi:hypothetical protein
LITLHFEFSSSYNIYGFLDTLSKFDNKGILKPSYPSNKILDDQKFSKSQLKLNPKSGTYYPLIVSLRGWSLQEDKYLKYDSMLEIVNDKPQSDPTDGIMLNKQDSKAESILLLIFAILTAFAVCVLVYVLSCSIKRCTDPAQINKVNITSRVNLVNQNDLDLDDSHLHIKLQEIIQKEEMMSNIEDLGLLNGVQLNHSQIENLH